MAWRYFHHGRWACWSNGIRLVFLGRRACWALRAIAMSFEYINWGEDNPHQVHESFLGLDNRKVGLWSFIGSECVFFASLISTYMVYKSRSIGRSRRRYSEYPADLVQYLHPADVELADGAGACRVISATTSSGVPSGYSAPPSSV